MSLTIHDTLLTARGRRVFFVSVLCVFSLASNAVDTKCFLRSAPNVNVVRNSDTRGQMAGATVNPSEGSQLS